MSLLQVILDKIEQEAAKTTLNVMARAEQFAQVEMLQRRLIDAGYEGATPEVVLHFHLHDVGTIFYDRSGYRDIRGAIARAGIEIAKEETDEWPANCRTTKITVAGIKDCQIWINEWQPVIAEAA